uniref:Transmembrane protein n=1 Tax=Guillardia theta TaxID=55529 RepID=A0A7S4P8W2_GUITH|mmetsp:Transcript_45253/g.142443  ORF Transcript_45253/g.142443 Transcript_45253/m.142443 type:complete len:212 (+) Transcript_45253:60-695(+)
MSSSKLSLSFLCFALSVLSAAAFVVPLTHVRALPPAPRGCSGISPSFRSMGAASSSLAVQRGAKGGEGARKRLVELVVTSAAVVKHKLASFLLLLLLGFSFSSVRPVAASSLPRSDVQVERQVMLTASGASMTAAEEDFSEWRPTTRTDLLKMQPHEHAAKKDFKHPILELVVNLLKILFPVFLIGLPIYIVFPWSLITDGHKGSNKKWLN